LLARTELDSLSRKIPELRQNLTKLNKEISDATKKKDDLEKNVNKLKEQETAANHCQADVIQIGNIMVR